MIAGMGFEKTVIIDGKVYEYMEKREMTDDKIKCYYDQVNTSGASLFFFSLLRTIHIYIYIYILYKRYNSTYTQWTDDSNKL